MTRALYAVTRLRGLALEEARRALGLCLRDETDAEGRARAARDAIAEQTEAACRLLGDDLAVEAFGAWLPHGRAAQRDAAQALSRATAATVAARAQLSIARAEAEAAAGLRLRLDDELRARAGRAAQHALDDATRRRS